MEQTDGETGIDNGTSIFPSEFPDPSNLLDQPGFSDFGFASFQTPFSNGVDPQFLHPVSGFEDSPVVNSISPFGPTESLAVATPNVQAEASTISSPPAKPGKRLSLNSVRILNKWLSNHTHHPYPSVRDVESIERQTGLTRQQILNWFANARRRKKFNPPETTDTSSAEASPRDIPLRRPPTPIVQQSPFERWENSPPEDEPSTMAAIARAVSGASGSIDQSQGTRTRHGRAPSSTGTWATTDTSDSSRSSKASGYSHASNRSLSRVIKKRRRGGLRARNNENRGLSVTCHRFQCTFCTETFKLKHTWSRHEKTQHLSLEQWECSPLGPSAVNDNSETVCVYCGFGKPDESHFEGHNHDLCHKRERGERIFYRKDHLRQHLRLVHGSEFMKWPMEEWKSKHEDVISRCGFCDITMTTWSERVNHLAEHFKEGRTMADWKGNWGFDAVTLDMVENHMPPYLIDYERNSPLPFSTQQGAPYSATSAFELLQLELDYFYSNYTDINHCIPSDEALHLEACCIIFGAEMNYKHPSTAASWLRDLIMSTQDIVSKARMTPMKSAARSRFSELKIHSKKDIFEDCKLEASLRQYVDMLQLLNLEIGDVELQKEACSIINHMPDVSPMFSQLLIGLVYGSTVWLAQFRERAGLPPSAVFSSNTPEGFVPLLCSGGLPAIFSNDQEQWSTPSGPDSPPTSLGQKIVSLNDGNMYRGLTRDLTRYVARTISPLNPTSHIPTDEELQYQARWIMYDSVLLGSGGKVEGGETSCQKIRFLYHGMRPEHSTSYFFNFLDRAAFANAYVAGLRESLSMTGHDYNTVLSVTTAGMAIGQLPHGIIIQKIAPRIWFPSMVVIWAGLTMASAAAKTVTQLCVIRFFLGLAEASTYAGTIYIIGAWYKPEEISKRTALFTAAGQVGTMFAGVMMTAIHKGMRGMSGLQGWQWVFLIDGIITLPIALFGFLYFPDIPEITKAKYLSQDERKLAVSRLPPIKTDGHNIMPMSLIKRVFLTPMFWILFFWSPVCASVEGFPFQNTFLLWLKYYKEKFSQTQINTYPLGVQAVGIAANMLAAWHMDATGQRVPMAILAVLLQVVVGAMLLVRNLSDAGVMFAFYLAGSAYMVNPLIFGWANIILQRTGDDAVRSVTLYSMNIGSMVLWTFWGIIFYSAADAPYWKKGAISLLACCGVMFCYIWLVQYLDKLTMKKYGDRTVEDLEGPVEVSESEKGNATKVSEKNLTS
ncbi:hypothetical protein FVER53590_13868 [Fusarium verticillioides]|nr:hypothetical protein FVER53590_13868 [Fusarium verticillioides]